MRLPFPFLPPRMPPTVLLALAGATGASFLFFTTTRQTYRRIAMGVGVGAVIGGSLAYFNDTTHRAEYHPSPPASIQEHHHPHHNFVVRMPFHTMTQKVYEHITARYDELGQLELGEEHVTVQPHVFAQIGVIDEDGIRSMWRMLMLDKNEAGKDGVVSKAYAARVSQPLVFCDLGSGVGNVCMQLLAETSCNKAVGIEIIPSRHRAAVQAMDNAKKYYPAVFRDKDAVFQLQDVVGCADTLNREGVNVLFTHSWMFDDELMHEVSNVVKKTPSLNWVITSRPLDESVLKETPLKRHKVVNFSADWNEKAPFHVYSRNVTEDS